MNTSPDPLFGSGIQLTSLWASHMSEASSSSIWKTLNSLPGTVRFALKIAWSADRWALLGAITAQIVQGVTGAAMLLTITPILTAAFEGGPTSELVRKVLPAVLTMYGLGSASSLMRALAVLCEGRLVPKAQRLTEQQLLEQAARVELIVMEDSSFHRSLESARLGVRSVAKLISGLLSTAGSLAAILAAGGVVGLLHPLLIPLLVLAVVPQAWKTLAVARWEHSSTMRSLNTSRQKGMLAGVLLARGPAAEEIRVHGLAEFLLGHYRRLASALELERDRLSRVRAGAGVLADAAAAVARVCAYASLAWLLVVGTIAVSTVGTVVVAISRLTSQLSQLLVQLNGVYTNSLFVDDYTRTMSLTKRAAMPVGGHAVRRSPSRIELRGVHFSYPGARKAAIRGVDIEFRRGEVIALVGSNGSGKSTLARLIAGLHLPSDGTVMWDGVEVNKLDRQSMFSQVAWIGQDFKRWPFTARVNTTLGRPGVADEQARLAAAATFSGIQEIVDGLPYGWETLLAREFHGGTNLSGGQWQRLAVARAHYRQAKILICDEPTAALDPDTEAETFGRLLQLAADGRTVVLITHRMGTVRHAQRIYVLEAGRIVEAGTYDRLLCAAGPFARMYQAQQRQYHAPGALVIPAR